MPSSGAFARVATELVLREDGAILTIAGSRIICLRRLRKDGLRERG